MLHRRYYTPSLQTTAEKEKVISDIKVEEPLYKKGNREITAKIAKDYPNALTEPATIENIMLFYVKGELQ